MWNRPLRRLRLVFALLCAIAGLLTISCGPNTQESTGAQEPGPPATDAPDEHRGGRWWQDTELAARLALSDDQVSAIRRLHHRNSIAQRENRSRERRLAVRMLVVMDKSPVNQKALDGLRARYEEITVTTIRQQVDVVRQLREILTDEQWGILWEERPAVIQIGRFKPIRPRMIRVTDQPLVEAGDAPATGAPN